MRQKSVKTKRENNFAFLYMNCNLLKFSYLKIFCKKN
jgi:hypothetical protein